MLNSIKNNTYLKTLDEIKKNHVEFKHLFTNKFSINEFGEILNTNMEVKKQKVIY